MSTHRLAPTLSLALFLAGGALHATDLPGLGEPLTDAEVAAIDFTVLPDGTGLPTGNGDAGQGAALYQQHCMSCHGDKGQGGPHDPIAGGLGSIATDAPLKTVGSYWPYATTLFDYIRRAMPFLTPGSLTDDETYSVTAYVLHLNGIVDAQASLDASTLSAINMPNRDGFVWAVPSTWEGAHPAQ